MFTFFISLYQILEDPSTGESVFVMEYIPMRSLSRFQGKLGEELAKFVHIVLNVFKIHLLL